MPMDFAAVLGAVALLKLLPRRLRNLHVVPIGAAVAAFLLMQVVWLPIQSAYAATEPTYRDHVGLGILIGTVFNRAEYRGGVIAVPGDEPTHVYTMVRYGGVSGNRITSEVYDPFYYLPAGYHYA